MLVLFTFLESKTVPNVVPFAGLILVELGFQSVSVIIHLATAIFLFDRVGPSRSELIRPGLAVQVDPVRRLYLPHSTDCWVR